MLENSMSEEVLKKQIVVYVRFAIALYLAIMLFACTLIVLLFVDYSGDGGLSRIPLALILILLCLSLLSMAFHLSNHIGTLEIINSISSNDAERVERMAKLSPFNPVSGHISLFRELANSYGRAPKAFEEQLSEIKSRLSKLESAQRKAAGLGPSEQ